MAKNENLEGLKQNSYKDVINKLIHEVIVIKNRSSEIDENVKEKLEEIEDGLTEVNESVYALDDTLTDHESRIAENETNISTNTDDISTIKENITTNTENIETLTETVTEISESPYVWIQTVDTSINNTGMHNSVYVGKSLGTSFTSLQAESIAENAFEDMYIGDYWTLSTNIGDTAINIKYRIGAFNYHQNTGDTALSTSTVLLVPDTILYSAPYNSSSTTEGGYVGSAMYTEEECVVSGTSYYGLKYAREGIAGTFGNSLVTYRTYLHNAVTDGYPSAGAWYNATVELMTEQMLYGSTIYGCTTGYYDGSVIVPNQRTIDKSQLPLFAMNPRLINIGTWYWLRNIVSAAGFACCSGNGSTGYNNANYTGGVRPFFLVS